jgi:hypothetical protein
MRYLAYISAALLLVALGYWLAPEKRIIEEKIVNRDVITKIIEKQLPDGTIITETEILDRSKEKSRIDSIPPTKTNIIIRGMAGIDFRSNNIVYGAGIDKRLLGPIWIGAYGHTNGLVGMSLSLSF